MYSKINYFLAAFFIVLTSFGQEGVAVYSDYLSDNYYLIHPSMAGAANCDKIRLTARGQWFGQQDAPALQTLSYNGRIGERSGGGIILFNDRNGYHAQKGVKITYTHHILFSRDEIDLNQFSFGISGGIIQSQLDETDFPQSNDPDPIIAGNMQSETYANFDVGVSYNFLDMYFHATVKNIFESRRRIYTDYESDNLRKYLLSGGYIFGGYDRLKWEPSILVQYAERTQEKSLDLNLKAYKNFDEGMIWGGLSYRTAIGVQKVKGNTGSNQKLQYVTPIFGVNYKKIMFAYTYSVVSGDVKYDNGAYHQITLGINLSCRKEKYDCYCPAVN
ncbi:type IX secretion system membrane protein PorP/SprF [Flavobacterium sp. ACN6]|uniref:PorP/SprF family type IX secretion system membrane protein n=1 Tax=Flavobacterium sp. ACN6 TaxID=1920426 RepID=UPI000BB3DDE1|nr:type IX secretion system membrane protein PorP/SprF [Flavobacterium sp. ACN6]PBJ04040.1 hypothetical protein BSF42_44580 [Flavobacterium sp. ACN6]